MKVLLPVDGSANSTRAAKYLAKHWPTDAAVTLVNVDAPLRESIAGRLDPESIGRFHADNGKSAIKAAARVLASAGHHFEQKLIVGDPGNEIVQLAHKGRFDLVVMGSHGRGLLKSLFLGSVVVKVLSSSRVPVLVVR